MKIIYTEQKNRDQTISLNTSKINKNGSYIIIKYGAAYIEKYYYVLSKRFKNKYIKEWLCHNRLQ